MSKVLGVSLASKRLLQCIFTYNDMKVALSLLMSLR